MWLIKTLVFLEQIKYSVLKQFHHCLVAATTSNTAVTMRISLKKHKKNRILHFQLWRVNCKEISGCECVCCTEKYAFIPWVLWRTKIKAENILNSPTYLNSLDGSSWYSTFFPLNIRWSNCSIRNYSSCVIFYGRVLAIKEVSNASKIATTYAPNATLVCGTWFYAFCIAFWKSKIIEVLKQTS